MQPQQLDALKTNHVTLLKQYGKPLIEGVYLKTCPKCNNVKPTTEYHRCKKSLDGFGYACKECTNLTKASNVVHVADVPKDFVHVCRKCNSDVHVNQISYMEVSSKGFACVCKTCKYSQRKNVTSSRTIDSMIAAIRRESLRIEVILGYVSGPLLPLKECSRCPESHKYHPITAFASNRSTVDGLSYYCRKCMATYKEK